MGMKVIERAQVPELSKTWKKCQWAAIWLVWGVRKIGPDVALSTVVAHAYENFPAAGQLDLVAIRGLNACFVP
jgi:hypothetical protein